LENSEEKNNPEKPFKSLEFKLKVGLAFSIQAGIGK